MHTRNGQSAGNGSVMRNTPIALWAAEDSLDALVALATQQAVLTHHDPHNGYGAAIHAAMIRAGMRGDDVFDAIDAVLGILPAAARERWAPLLAPGWQPDPGKNNGTAWTCLAEAVWAVRNAANFEEAVVTAADSRALPRRTQPHGFRAQGLGHAAFRVDGGAGLHVAARVVAPN